MLKRDLKKYNDRKCHELIMSEFCSSGDSLCGHSLQGLHETRKCNASGHSYLWRGGMTTWRRAPGGTGV